MFFMWAAIFFLIAIVAATFGFTDISADASHIAKNPVLHFFGGLFNFAPFWIPPVQKGQVRRPRDRSQGQLERTGKEDEIASPRLLALLTK